MRSILFVAPLLIGQMAMQDLPVVRLTSNRSVIQPVWGGMLVELIDAPSSVLLPLQPPKVDSQGRDWQVRVKNLGPAPVTISSKAGFTVKITVGQTIGIGSDGAAYSLKH